MQNSPSIARSLKQIALLLPLGLSLAACQHVGHPRSGPSNGPELAERFVKPVDGLVGIVVGRDGNSPSWIATAMWCQHAVCPVFIPRRARRRVPPIPTCRLAAARPVPTSSRSHPFLS